jgi:hypothetical protein
MTYLNLGDSIVNLDQIRGIKLTKGGNILEVIYVDNEKFTYDVSHIDSKALMSKIWEIIQGIAPQEW